MMDKFEGNLTDMVEVPEDIQDTLTDLNTDIDLDSMSLDELYALRDELTNNGDTGDVPSHYSFKWDGIPTHNVEWDDEPGEKTYVLKR
mgnify:CR=1 FL=1